MWTAILCYCLCIIETSEENNTSINTTSKQLAYNYYELTCPFLEDIVRKQMLIFFAADASAPSAFLRLFFHDCQVQVILFFFFSLNSFCYL